MPIGTSSKVMSHMNKKDFVAQISAAMEEFLHTSPGEILRAGV